MTRCIRGMCAALLLVCGASVGAADFYEDVFLLARRLEESGAEKEAATEYKRYLFLQDFSAGSHCAESYAALSHYYGALSSADSPDAPALALNYTRLAVQCETDAQRATALRQKEMDLLLARSVADGSSLQADPIFFSYLYLPDFSADIQQYAWCTFLAHCAQTDRWDVFETSVSYVQSAFPLLFTQDEQEALFSALVRYQAFKPKNLTLAMWLSLLPGLGQLYAHDFKDAANAFLLDGALIGISVYSLVTFQWWDFSLLEFSPLLRFYRGNLYNAQKDAHRYNEKKQAELRQPILDMLAAARSRISEHVFASPQ